MFGYVTASMAELSEAQKQRYLSCYCGLCKALGRRHKALSRLTLSYDMVFLTMLLGSLYEPEEEEPLRRCLLHPTKQQPMLQSPAADYGADLTVALAYFNADDNWRDDKRPDALLLKGGLYPAYQKVSRAYPRQCQVMEESLRELSRLEQEHCDNPDLPANAFGRLMAELFVWKEDLWQPYLREMAMGLGRYIYFVDAAVDYKKDRETGSYNPFLAMGAKPLQWEPYLVQEMGRCTRAYEVLPLVRDKEILDNILYSGIWLTYRQKKENIT